MIDTDMRVFAIRPKMPWARIHRWLGVALFGLFCAGVGNAAATAQFQVPWLQGRSATLQHVETHDIPKLKALIPKDAGAAKSEGATAAPPPKDCPQ